MVTLRIVLERQREGVSLGAVNMSPSERVVFKRMFMLSGYNINISVFPRYPTTFDLQHASLYPIS